MKNRTTKSVIKILDQKLQKDIEKTDEYNQWSNGICFRKKECKDASD